MPFLSEDHVQGAGLYPCEWAVVGDSPTDRTETTPFSDNVSTILWPLMVKYGKLSKEQVFRCYLSERPIDGELTEGEFKECQAGLLKEMAHISPKRILAVGSLASKALLGDQFTDMYSCSGGSWPLRLTPSVVYSPPVVVPCFHPSTSMRPGGERDLAFMVKAIERWADKDEVKRNKPPLGLLAIDTEGLPDDPICLTWACRRNLDGPISKGTVFPEYIPDWWEAHARHNSLVWHNALWDWKVMEAMGVKDPWDVPHWSDTMEWAYLRQTEPQGLKALAWKHLGIKMKSFMDVVGPHYEEIVRAVVAGRIEAGTSYPHRVSLKTGKMLKPKVAYTDEAKKLKRLRALDSMVEATGFGPPTLRVVPEEEAKEYAEGDAVATLLLAEKWMGEVYQP